MLYSFTSRKRKYFSGASKVKNKKMREHERSMLLNPIAHFFSKMEYPATHNKMAEPDNLDFSEFREKKKYARNFQTTWFHQFPWIELSMDKTKAFCNLCKWAFQNKRLDQECA